MPSSPPRRQLFRIPPRSTRRTISPRPATDAVIAAGLALATLGGCTSLDARLAAVQADTTVSAPAGWSEQPGSSAILPAGSPSALPTWWRQFGDDELNWLIERALAGAPDVRSARARLRQARAARALAEADLYPSLDVSASAGRTRSGTAAGGNDTPQRSYRAGFDASWEPSLFGGLRDAAEGAQADAAAAQASLENTRASLAAEVAREYIGLRASQRRLDIVRANVASQAETLQITEWRELAGLVTHLDVEQARTNLAQSQATLPSLEQSRAEAENRLAILTGQAPGSLRARLQETQPLPTAPDSIAVGIPADTLRQRPDVRAAAATLRAEIARTAEREADRYPTLNLAGSFGWQTFSLSAFGADALVRSLTASLAAPLFDAGRIASRVEAQRAIQEQALIAWESSLLTALEDVENAMVAYAQGRTRVDARRRAATAAANAAELARTQYQAGLIDFQSVLQTERTLLGAQDDQASAETDVLTAVIQLYKALGGGWQGTPDSAGEPPAGTIATRTPGS